MDRLGRGQPRGILKPARRTEPSAADAALPDAPLAVSDSFEPAPSGPRIRFSPETKESPTRETAAKLLSKNEKSRIEFENEFVQRLRAFAPFEAKALNSLDDEENWAHAFNELAEFVNKGPDKATSRTKAEKKALIERRDQIIEASKEARVLGQSLVELLLSDPKGSEHLFSQMALKSSIPMNYVLDFAKSLIESNEHLSDAEKEPLIRTLDEWQELI